MGMIPSVLREMPKITGVVESYALVGVYDVICKIEAETLKDLKNIISNEIRSIQGINATMTLVVF
jgi:DNA-binding Lrp family transcriptional regulator